MNQHGSLNRVYRLIYSRVLNAWVAVSEITRGQGKGGRSGRKLALMAATMMLVPLAQGAPTGGLVTAGVGKITQAGNTTTISQGSQNLNLSWTGFNISPNETVDFVQPSASAVAVNRITSTTESQILGHLNANGQIYLIDPNGILFGKGAEVNVGGLVASTFDLTGSNGNSVMFGGKGSGNITNLGSITASHGGYVALLGHQVLNEGTVTAQLGSIVLAGGSAVTLTFSGSQVGVVVSESQLNDLASNGGILQANGGNIVLTAGAKDALLASTVNNTGLVEADTINATAGHIQLLSGMSAGTTANDGMLSAAAPVSGNGGFIETSGYTVSIGNSSVITTKAANGLNGTWLIDPADFTIASTATGTVTTGTPSGDISGSTLSSALGAGNVTILSSQGSTAAGTGNINVNDVVSWSANTLTLTAANNIDVSAVMTVSGTGSIALNPATANGTAAAVTGGTLNMGMSAAGTVNASTGNAFTGQINVSGTGTVSINGTPYGVISTNVGLPGMTPTGDYVLGGNLNASGMAFTPIATFTGALDGLGHTVSNLTINLPTVSNVGLFATTGGAAAIRNLGIASGSVTGNAYVGGLVGYNLGTISNSYASEAVTGIHYVGGLVGQNHGTSATITNSYTTGTVTGNVGSDDVGGLAGNNNGTLSNDYATGNVTGATNGLDTGGLVGYNYGPISNSHATGSVSGGSVSGANYVGGLVGHNYGHIISNSYATGNVTTGVYVYYVGGLVGLNNGTGATISNSYATGSVSGGVFVGGLVGRNDGAITNGYATGSVSGSEDTGGLVGYTYGTGSAISNSYATGSVTGETGGAGYYIGGLVGSAYGGTISNSYATGNVASLGTGLGFGVQGIGGLVGIIYGATTVNISNSYATGSVTTGTGSHDVGGLAGYNLGGTVNNSYATGSITTGTGSSDVGGLIGSNTGTIGTSYWDTTTSGQAVGIGGTGASQTGVTGLSTLQMQTASNFAGFTFTTTPGATGNNWVMVDANGTLNNAGGALGATFPMLASEYSTTINNAHQLQLMAMNLAGSYTLGSNIDASNTVTSSVLKDIWSTMGGFVPVGDSTTSFTGTFDGLNHTVSNPTINLPTTNDVGLFGSLGTGGTVKNVGLTGGGVTGASYVGGLVGLLTGGTISNSYATGSVTGGFSVGGLVGQNSGTVSNAHATGSVNGSGAADWIGGLVGYNSHGTISNAYATGSVSSLGDTVGGLVGYNYHGTISNAYATGSVSGTGGTVGGLVGANAYGTISNAYATGSVSGSTIGETGGLVGSNYGTLTNVYATGAVSGSGVDTGGLVGYNDGTRGGTVIDGYWNTTFNGALPGIGGSGASQTGTTGLTTSQMQAQASFTGFDFTVTPVWGFHAGVNNGYPVLCVFGGCGVKATTTVYIDPVTGSSVYGTAPLFSYSLVNSAGLPVTLTNALLTGTAIYGGAVGSSLPTTTSNVGSYNFDYVSGLGLTGTGSASYSLSSYATPSVWNVTKAPLTVTGLSGTNRIYNGSTVDALTGTPTFAGLVGSQTVALGNETTAGTLASANAGSEGVTAGLTLANGSNGGLASNYSLTQPTLANVTIAPAPLTVTANNASKTYGQTATFAGTAFTSSGLQNGETIGSVTEASTGSASTATVAGGPYGIVASNATGGSFSAGNYTISYVNGQLTVNPAVLTYLATSTSMIQGQALPVLSGTVVGFVGADTLANSTTGTLVWTTPATKGSAPGQYAIEGSGLAVDNPPFIHSGHSGNELIAGSLLQLTTVNYVLVESPANATALTVSPAAQDDAVLTDLEGNLNSGQNSAGNSNGNGSGFEGKGYNPTGGGSFYETGNSQLYGYLGSLFFQVQESGVNLPPHLMMVGQ